MPTHLSTLRSLIDQADDAYWVKHQPIMSDQEYDNLIEQLRVVSPDDPRLNRIGGSAGEVVHDPPMLSLDKRYTHSEIVEWCRSMPSTTFLIQPKYDGISGKLVYTDHRWQLSTRGDGYSGENITRHLPRVELITNNHLISSAYTTPTSDLLTQVTDLPLYGELVITDLVFKNYFLTGKIVKPSGELYATQRNTVAGMLGSNDPIPTVGEVKLVQFIDYAVNSIEVSIDDIADEENWSNLVTEVTSLGYPVDGAVLKLPNVEQIRELGSTQHHPRGMMAFKFANQSKMTKITGIEWNVGMRSITPKAIVEPVVVNNVVIKQATLFNLAYVIKNDFRVGDYVKIERAGDVIPHICTEDHTRNGGEQAIPRVCPVCRAPVTQEDVELVCTNPTCPGTRQAVLAKALKELKIKGIGDVTLSNLVNSGVTRLDQLLSISQIDSLASVAGVSPRVAETLLNSINEAKSTATPAAVLSAMGIPRISQATAAVILTAYSLEDLVEVPHDVLTEMMRPYGENGASIVRWMADPANAAQLAAVMTYCTNREQTSGEFTLTVCFTGRMSEPRDKLAQLARTKGYMPVLSVTKDLSLLVVPDDEPHDSTKLYKARRYGIQVVTESQFRAM